MSDERLTPQAIKDLSDAQLTQAVEAAVREFLKTEGGAENAADLPADQELWAQFDSLLIMELLVHLEEQFGVPLNTGALSPNDLKTIASIRDVAASAIRAAQG